MKLLLRDGSEAELGDVRKWLDDRKMVANSYEFWDAAAEALRYMTKLKKESEKAAT